MVEHKGAEVWLTPGFYLPSFTVSMKMKLLLHWNLFIQSEPSVYLSVIKTRFQLDVCKNGFEKCPCGGKDFYINLLIIIPVLKVRVCPRKYLSSKALFLCTFHDCSCTKTFLLEGLTGIRATGGGSHQLCFILSSDLLDKVI